MATKRKTWCPATEEGPEFTVNDIKHFYWCEAIIYVKHFLGIKETPTEYMVYGSEQEVEKHVAFAVRAVKAVKVLKHPYLEDPELSLGGAPDYVLITRQGEAVPLEVKWSEPGRGGTPKRDHLMQLTAYALLIERCLRKEIKSSVKRGLIYYLRPEGKLIKATITYGMKANIIKALRRMKAIAAGTQEPKPRTNKCGSCNYARHCPYAET